MLGTLIEQAFRKAQNFITLKFWIPIIILEIVLLSLLKFHVMIDCSVILQERFSLQQV